MQPTRHRRIGPRQTAQLKSFLCFCPFVRGESGEEALSVLSAMSDYDQHKHLQGLSAEEKWPLLRHDMLIPISVVRLTAAALKQMDASVIENLPEAFPSWISELSDAGDQLEVESLKCPKGAAAEKEWPQVRAKMSFCIEQVGHAAEQIRQISLIIGAGILPNEFEAWIEGVTRASDRLTQILEHYTGSGN